MARQPNAPDSRHLQPPGILPVLKRTFQPLFPLISKAAGEQLVCHGRSAACVELQRSYAAFHRSLASSVVVYRHPLAASKVGAPVVLAPNVGDKGKLSFSLHTKRSAAGLQQQPRV